MAKAVVVTGSSSGIGYETSLLLARNQFTTYATMRNLSKGDGLREIASKEIGKLVAVAKITEL
jgi:NAD(P)-dependent dehydrogenase (short-subunit alcohol dehydrogenase family)